MYWSNSKLKVFISLLCPTSVTSIRTVSHVCIFTKKIDGFIKQWSNDRTIAYGNVNKVLLLLLLLLRRRREISDPLFHRKVSLQAEADRYRNKLKFAQKSLLSRLSNDNKCHTDAFCPLQRGLNWSTKINKR